MDTVRLVVAAVALVIAVPRALAAPAGSPAGVIALLPLDADPTLELYGQPIASELARALTSGGLAVVVVGAREPVPARAQLIVDGTIAAGKGDEVVIALRIRNKSNGTVLDTLSATASGIASIDRTTSQLSARMLPAVHERLAALAIVRAPAPTSPDRGAVAMPAGPPPLRPCVLAIGGTSAPALTTALATVAVRWARDRGRDPQVITLAGLAAQTAVAKVVAHHADLGISLDAVALQIDHGAVPLARATVRVRIASGARVVFDRTVVTDSVVGERGTTDAALAERAADAVLDIIAPHLARLVPGWPSR